MAEVLCPNCQTPHEPCSQIYITVVSCSCKTMYWAADGQVLTDADIKSIRGERASVFVYERSGRAGLVKE
jgi:hypothetical protein